MIDNEIAIIVSNILGRAVAEHIIKLQLNLVQYSQVQAQAKWQNKRKKRDCVAQNVIIKASMCLRLFVTV